MTSTPLRLGTRGSELALWQARHVTALIAERLGRATEIVVVKTQGDQIQNVAFHKMEGKGFFTKELQEALLERRVDLVVHSMKDLPTEEPPGLALVAIPERDNPADLLLARPGLLQPGPGLGLPAGAVLGTSSLRRAAQALATCPGITVTALRGNVPTRVQKLRDGGFDAIMLAAAGIRRLALDLAGLDPRELTAGDVVSAPAQGALAIEARADDEIGALLTALHDPAVARCVSAERGLLKLLGGGCHIPLGCLATRVGDNVRLEAVLGEVDEDLTRAAIARVVATAETPEAAARACYDLLCAEALDLVPAAARPRT